MRIICINKGERKLLLVEVSSFAFLECLKNQYLVEA